MKKAIFSSLYRLCIIINNNIIIYNPYKHTGTKNHPLWVEYVKKHPLFSHTLSKITPKKNTTSRNITFFIEKNVIIFSK